MKKWHQVISLLASRKPATEEDKKAIIAFCKKKGLGNIYFKGGTETSDPDVEQITIEEFVDWFSVNHFAPGEVVLGSDNSIFLITDFINGNSISKAHINSQKEFSIDPVIINIKKRSLKVTVDDKLALQRAMSMVNLCWNPRKNIIVEKTHPNDGQYAAIWLIDDLIGLGIFKEINAEGNIVLYCFLDMKGDFIYNKDWILGSENDYTVKQAVLAEKSQVISELTAVNFNWDARRKRLEPIDFRRKKGEIYNYITSCGRVRNASEGGRDIDNRRFKIGNYFHTPEDAEQFFQYVVLERKNYFAGGLDLEKCP